MPPKILKSAAEIVKDAIKAVEAEKKASEALGKVEGKTLMVTESDRTKVGQGYLGGPGFSSLQLTDPAYRDVGAVWGVAAPGKATTILNASRRVPEGEHVFTTMVGSPTQHRSNQQVFNKLLDEFRASAREGNLSDELRGRINDSLRSAINKEGNPIFAPNVDIMSPKFRKQANTFERRAVAADLIAGEGIGGKKGQIIDFDKVMRRTTDPMLLDVPTGSMGPRLFTLSGETIQRPDLHPAFPSILTGEDLGVAFQPAPIELMFRDYVKNLMETKGRKSGYMDITRGHGPKQFISEDLLTEMQKAGYAKGGSIDLEAEYRMAKGGPVKMADGGDLEEEYNLRKMGMDPTRVRGGYERKPLSRAEIQAMMLDVPAGLGVPFAEAGAYALRGKTDEAKESAAIEAALMGIPAAAVLAKPAYRAVKKGVQKAAPAVREAAYEALESAMESGLIQGPLYAVKPSGGQWLGRGNVLDVTRQDDYIGPASIQARRKNADASRQAYEQDPTDLNRRLMGILEAEAQRSESAGAVNNWIDANLQNYLRKQMGTPDDPVLKLADQGILHMPYQETSVPKGLAEQREKAGFPAEGLATTDLGRMWETMADRSIASIEAGKLTDPSYLKNLERRARENDPLFNLQIDGSSEMRLANERLATDVMTSEEAQHLQRFKRMNSPLARANVMQENQWLSRVDPKTPIYSLSNPFGGSMTERDLGFDHVIDVLKADLAAGRIRPEQLSKMSMEQAVRRTNQYDVERAAAMAKAAEEEMAGLTVSKTFDDGYKIVQLNKPGQFAKESDRMGHSVRGYEPERGSKEWSEASGVEGSSLYGHGGWEGIKSGNAQVFSIRDAKNQPHVTIELGPSNVGPQEYFDSLNKEQQNAIQLAMPDYYGASQISRYIAGTPEYQAWKASQPKVITQIKGKQNRVPDEDYLPYVQKFIREGNYEITGNLKNSGLIDTKQSFAYQNVPDKLWRVQENLPQDAPRYITEAELERFAKTGKFEPDFKKGGAVQGYAKGGSIKSGADRMNLEQQFQNAVMGLKSPLKGERRYDQGGFVQSKLFNGLPFDIDALYAERQAILREQGINDPRYIEQIWKNVSGTGEQSEVRELKNRLIAAAGYSPSELKKLDNVDKMIGSVITQNRTPEMNQALRQIVANEQKYQEALRLASEANKLKQDKTIDPQLLQRELASAKLGVMQSAADLNKSMGAFFGTEMGALLGTNTFDKIEPSSQYKLDRDEMNLLGIAQDPLTQEYVPQRMATRAQAGTGSQSGVQSKLFNGAPFNGEAFEAERQSIMREYGLDFNSLSNAYNGYYQGAGLNKGQSDEIRARLQRAAGYTPEELNALPNIRAILGTAVVTGGEAEANQIRDRIAREQTQYQEALNWMKPVEERRQELINYLEGRSPSFGGTPGMSAAELESRYLSELRQNPESLQQFLVEAKRLQDARERDPELSEKEQAGKKLFAFQRAVDLNNTMETFLGRGNFEPVEVPRLNAREMQLLRIKEGPTGGYATPDDRWYGEGRPLDFLTRNDNSYNSIFGNTLVNPNAYRDVMQEPSTDLASDNSLGIQVIVYGPDGTVYSSPAAARQAGVFNYTKTPPAKSPGNVQAGSGLITNHGPGMGLAPNLSTNTKGGTPPTNSGLITNHGPGMGQAPILPDTGMPPLDLSAALTAITPTPVSPTPRLNINPVVTPTIQTGTMTPTAAPQIDVQRIGRNLGAIPMRSGGAAIMKDGGRIKPDYKAALDMLFYQMRNKG